MNLNEYQDISQVTAIYPGQGTTNGLTYAALGLAGEAGEVANKVKKIIRDCGGVISTEAREAILDECGDTLWYLSAIATELNEGLAWVAEANIQKLTKRAAGKKLGGSGDVR